MKEAKGGRRKGWKKYERKHDRKRRRWEGDQEKAVRIDVVRNPDVYPNEPIQLGYARPKKKVKGIHTESSGVLASMEKPWRKPRKV